MNHQALKQKKEECLRQLQEIFQENGGGSPALLSAVQDLLDELIEEYSCIFDDLQRENAALQEAAENYRSLQQRDYPEALLKVQTYAEELAAANEELHLANEELNQINEALNQRNADLIATRKIVERERQRYYDLFDAAPEGYLVTDRNGTILEANHAVASLLAVHKESLAGRNLVHFIAGGSKEEFRTRMARAKGGIHQQNWEVQLQPLGNEPVYVSVSIAPVNPRGSADPSIRWMIRDITERRRMEEALREEESRYRTIMENIYDVVYSYSLDGRITYISPNVQTYFGYAPSEMIGHSLFEYVHPEDMKSVLKDFQRTIATSEEFPTYCRLIRKDGSMIHIEEIARKVVDPAGTIMGYFGVIRDITERKRLEEARRESVEQYRRLFETMLQGVVHQDAQGRITSMNPAAERILGKSPHEFLGRTSVDEEDHTLREDGSPFPGLEHPSMVALRTGQEVHDVVMGVYNPRETRIRWISISAVPLYQPGEDTPYEVYTLFDDITERKQAEEALRDRERFLKDIFNSIQDGISILDRDMTVLRVNSTMERWYAHQMPLVGKKCHEAYHGSDQPCTICPTRRMLATKEPTQDKVPLTGADGAVKGWLELYSFPFIDERSGELKGVIEYVRDITKRTQAEEALKQYTLELRHYADNLKRSNEDLERFAYVSSHDLQEPLRTIVSFTQLLDRRYRGRLDPEADEYIHYIVDAGKRMQNLINDLLEYSRVSSQAQTFQPVHAEEVLARALLPLAAIIEEEGARVSHDPLPIVQADERQLRQVFQNLVSNALKYRKEKEPLKVHVSARRTDGFWEFSIADNGIGIESQYYERIFIIFQRLHGRDKYSGTGIGLALVKRIVERHGGRIWVESEPGKGSTFFFTLLPAVGESSSEDRRIQDTR